MKRKTSLLSAAGLVVAVLLLAPAHAGASSGSIQGGTADDNAQTAHVDNLFVTMDQCGAGDDCAWGVEAWLVYPGGGVDCPPRPRMFGDTPIWISSTADSSEILIYSANGTMQSGPLDFEGSSEDFVCLYLDSEINFSYDMTLVASKQLVSTGLPDKDKALKKCKKHKHHAASAKKHCKKKKQ